MPRCVNLDWLEVYCEESAIGYPHDVDFFLQKGWNVKQREYGTRIYEEMFTLYGTDDMPLLEIRRKPKSSYGMGGIGILNPYSCHIRLSNRTCYFNNPVDVLNEFLQRYGYGVSRISRLDICLDFERFDYGDLPATFLERYIKKRYSKINQANIASRGRDMWDGRKWNYIAWGSLKSMVGTKFYNKTLELKEKKDKPYIRQAWFASGLVNDAMELTQTDKSGKTYYPEIWRVEFSIKSGTRNWFIVEDWRGRKKKLRSIRHTLEMYRTKQQLLDMFMSLADHYFHFKKVVEKPSKAMVAPALSVVQRTDLEKSLQRKDRCPDKLLFKLNDVETFYKLDTVATETPKSKDIDRLLARLIEYQSHTVQPAVWKACEVLIAKLEEDRRLHDLTFPWPESEVLALRMLIARRIKNPGEPLSVSKEVTEALLSLEQELF